MTLLNSLESSFVHARLPRAGLGNKLIVWANALVYARTHRLPLYVSNWISPQLTPFLRSGDLRWYGNYFKHVDEIGFFRRLALRDNFAVAEPEISVAPVANTTYRFEVLSHWSDHFLHFKTQRTLVNDSLLAMLSEARQKEIAGAQCSEICVQVRLGDFAPLAAGADFAKVGATRTPLRYFIDLVEKIQAAAGKPLTVAVFSDGTRAELEELLAVPNTVLSPKRTAIADIFIMSKAKILILSAGSTFGAWAGLLGDCAVITHPDHTHQSIRDAKTNERLFEGKVSGPMADWPKEFIAAINALV